MQQEKHWIAGRNSSHRKNRDDQGKTGGHEKTPGEGSGKRNRGTAYGSLHQGAHVRAHERVASAWCEFILIYFKLKFQAWDKLRKTFYSSKRLALFWSFFRREQPRICILVKRTGFSCVHDTRMAKEKFSRKLPLFPGLTKLPRAHPAGGPAVQRSKSSALDSYMPYHFIQHSTAWR